MIRRVDNHEGVRVAKGEIEGLHLATRGLQDLLGHVAPFGTSILQQSSCPLIRVRHFDQILWHALPLEEPNDETSELYLQAGISILAVPVGTVIHPVTSRVGRMCSW